MMSENSDFLARWSRRKQEARRGGAAEDAKSPEPAPDAQEPSPDAGPEELTGEELAALPKVEDFTIDTDLAQFMRKGVPLAMQKAALRRMWVLDPAIRDFVSEAREYAYDWNVPGGVPGTGRLLDTDKVAEMVQRIIGRFDTPEAVPTPVESAESAAGVHHAEGTGPQASVNPEEPSGASDTAPDGALSRMPARRHGGAVPT
jgi:hypothetical protein